MFFYVGEDDPKIYPKHLDKMLETEFIFRVKYQRYYHQSSVLKCTRDEAVIKNIKFQMQPDEIQPEEIQTQTNLGGKNNTECSDSLTIATQSLSVCGENEFDQVVNITPAK